MKRATRLSLSLLLAATFVPAASADGVPSPSNSTVPACITLVGHTGGVPSSVGRFEVIVRDLANNPVVDEPVTVDLSNAPDLFLSAQQFDAGLTVDCTQKRVTRVTDSQGRAVFTIIGGSNGTGNAVSLLNAGRISSLHLGLLGIPTVAAYDLDGVVGVGANDLSAWLWDFVGGSPFGRSDYDCSGSIGANDLSFWLGAFGSSTMTQSGSCP